MFAESTRVCFLIRNSVLYIYIQRTYLCPALFHLFLFSLLYYIYIRETLFPALTLSRHFLTFSLFTLLLYTLYIERNTLSRNFLPFSRSFLYFYYTPLIYRIGNTLSALFYPSYKVNTFTPPLSLLFYSLGKVCGEKFLKTLLVQFYNTYISFQKLCIYSFIKLSCPHILHPYGWAG